MIRTQNTHNKSARPMWLLFALVAVIVVSDFILFKSQPFGIKQILYFASIAVAIGALVVSIKVDNKFVAKFLPQLAFVIVFFLISYQLLIGDVKSNYVAMIGLSLLLIWHGSQSVVSFKISLPVSIVAVIGLLAVSSVLFGVAVELLVVLFMVMALSIVLGELSGRSIGSAAEVASVKQHVAQQDDLPEDEFSEEELEDFMSTSSGVDYAMVDVNASEESHDWEYVLRELHNELKNMHDVDALFKSLLIFMSGTIDFDAAAVGMIQERSLNKISVSGPDELTHSKVLNWNADLVSKLTRSMQPEISQQDYVDEKGEMSVMYRIDVPVVSYNKMIGLVTMIRHSMCFNEYETKLATSIVFHGMIALRMARLQEDVKRQTTASANKTLFTREQFFEKANIELEKITQPRVFSLLLIELDDIENVSESLGMNAATQLYKGVATTLLSLLGAHDVLGRYGKEGFMVLLHETDLLNAKEKGESFRQKVSQYKCKTSDGVVTTTVSIGLASVSEQGETMESLIKKADMGLFVAKESGRNSVKVSL